ncbi:SRPBCC family protein [Pseudoroseicyclus tamaricis]|uniref:ATPase n=1 Tax=Pseudoroseicyclus tamaricis TaxID=2705421 RepID=A0A6B2K164_9RHOB|nr:SRPBCC family protein [Pseudoroseicyclus tamaricis]NDV02174.1 ATPase [Pseudoroseicyclus tamaricis]
MTEQTDEASPLDTWELEREIVLTQLYPHPREVVFAAWTDPAALSAWFGPEGLAIETKEADIREGGHWKFDMVGADGTRFENLMQFRRIVAPSLIVADHGDYDPQSPDRFRLTVTFDQQDDGQTVLTLRQLHPSPARRETVIGFGAVAYGMQTLAKLGTWLG